MAIEQPLSFQKKKHNFFLELMVQCQGSTGTLATETGTPNNAKSVRSVLLKENKCVELVIPREKTALRDVRPLSKQVLSQEVLHILHVMDHQGIDVDSCTYNSLLKSCIDKKSLPDGKLVHAHIIGRVLKPDTFLANKLVLMYAKCGCLGDAHKVFYQMPKRNIVSWTVMIAVYARHGLCEEALTLFRKMKHAAIQPNQFTFASVLPACANLAALELGKEIHEKILRSGFQSNVFVGSALIDMYVKCGSIKYAHKVFDRMPERNVVSWNTLVSGYAEKGDVDKALELFQKMPEQDVVSWNAMIAGYAQNGYLYKALELFNKMPERDVISWNAMIAGFSQNGYVEEARKLFQEMPHRNVVSWTAMISGYAQNGHVDKALKLFQKMPERDLISWSAMIAGYSKNGHVDEALKLFNEMPEQGLFSWTTMVAGYAHNGQIHEALTLFQNMPKRNVVSWNAMITGYARNGLFYEALMLFQQMQLADMKADSDTFASVLQACANLAALEHGKEVHEDIIRGGFQFDVSVENALIDMYAKCGSIRDAGKVFHKMPLRDVISWTAMIIGYAMHGYGRKAIQVFEGMQHYGTKPDHVTFLGVLLACCHAGLVDDGLKYFECMSEYYHITPTMDHYCCMVDLLGRYGCLDEAQLFINKMPIKPDTSVWGSLLGACRSHSNIELGESVAERLFELDPKNAAPYVLLANIYALLGRWEDVKMVRKMMKEKKVKKKPGCSWIQVNKQVHAFVSGH